MEAATLAWGTWPKLLWLGLGPSWVMNVAFLDARTLDPGSMDYEMGQPLPSPAVILPFVSSHTNSFYYPLPLHTSSNIQKVTKFI